MEMVFKGAHFWQSGSCGSNLSFLSGLQQHGNDLQKTMPSENLEDAQRI
jgi:hypothetical protein